MRKATDLSRRRRWTHPASRTVLPACSCSLAAGTRRMRVAPPAGRRWTAHLGAGELGARGATAPSPPASPAASSRGPCRGPAAGLYYAPVVRFLPGAREGRGGCQPLTRSVVAPPQGTRDGGPP